MKKNRPGEPKSPQESMRKPEEALRKRETKESLPDEGKAPKFAKPDELGKTEETRRAPSPNEYEAYRAAQKKYDETVRQGKAKTPPRQARNARAGQAQQTSSYDTEEQATRRVQNPRALQGSRAGQNPYQQRDQRYGRNPYGSGAQDPRQRTPYGRIPKIDPRTGRPVQMNGRPDRRGGPAFWLYLILELLFIAGSIWLSRTIIVYDMGTTLHHILFFAGIAILHILLIALLVRGYKHPAPRAVGLVLTIVLLVLNGVAIYYSEITVRTLDKISSDDPAQISEEGEVDGAQGRQGNYQLSLVVKAETPIETLDELDGVEVAVPMKQAKEDVEELLKEIRSEAKVEPKLFEVETFVEGVNALYAGDVEGAVIASDTFALLKDEHPDVHEDLRIINSYAPPQETLSDKRVKDPARQPFIMYISGIDSYDLSQAARSDVNMIMTVNPLTHEVLMTNVPRDSYLPIQGRGGGNLDKLTHAGVYGIQSSVRTLEEFFDVDINYYTKVNFQTLIQLVDELGGLIIDNPYSFVTNDGKYQYPIGRIALNGDQTLWYVRERYNLPEGDLSRGENQQRVLKALIEKILSPDILKHYTDILSVVEDSFQTNMPTQHMMKLVTHQLTEMPEWDIETANIKGTGSQEPSYAAGGLELSVVIPDEETVEEAKDEIHALLEAE